MKLAGQRHLRRRAYFGKNFRVPLIFLSWVCQSVLADRIVKPLSDPKTPIVEQTPNGDQSDDCHRARALGVRIRQQELLAELGVLALQGTSFVEMLNHTARVTAEGLEAEYCKVLEYIPADNRLLVRAGIGWGEGVVGHATVGADSASPAGYALHTGKPVISNHLENEQQISYSGVAHGAWYSPCDERHFAG